VKAFSRRASARVELKKYEDAKADYKQVLTLEPSNKLAKTELKRIEQVSEQTIANEDLVQNFVLLVAILL
jgi:hypothetical protein